MDDRDRRQTRHDRAGQEVVHLKQRLLGAHATHIDLAFCRADVELSPGRVAPRLHVLLFRRLGLLDNAQLVFLDRHLHRTGLHLHIAVFIRRRKHIRQHTAHVEQPHAVALFDRPHFVRLNHALADAAALLVLGLRDHTAQRRLGSSKVLVRVFLLRLFLQVLKFVEHGLGGHARVLQDAVRLAARALEQFIRARLGRVALGAHLIPLGLGGRTHLLRLILHLLDAAALALELGEHVLKPRVLGRNLFLGALDDGGLQPQPRRDCKCVGLARDAGQQAVGRLE